LAKLDAYQCGHRLAHYSRASPRRSSSGLILGSLPRKALKYDISGAVPPRLSNTVGNVSPASRTKPPLSMNHSTVSASRTSLQI